MKSKQVVLFDKLDHKCFAELPLLVDVLSSTLNKIGSLISVYHLDLLKFVKKELKAKHGWRVKQDNKLNFYPLSYGNRRKINLLESRMEAFDEIEVIRKHGNNVKSAFWIHLGLWCKYSGELKQNNIYFSIHRGYDLIRKYGFLHSLNYYNSIAKKVKDLKCEILHPDDESDYEEIYIWCEELDIEKLNNYYERFKTDIVRPYIRNLD